MRDFLVIQCLRLHASNQGGGGGQREQVRSLVRELDPTWHN